MNRNATVFLISTGVHESSYANNTEIEPGLISQALIKPRKNTASRIKYTSGEMYKDFTEKIHWSMGGLFNEIIIYTRHNRIHE